MAFIAIILLLFSVSSSFATDYYFKQSGSSDSNPCTESLPCTSMAKFATINPNAGDRMFFNCGDTFTDTSGNGIDWTSRSGTSVNHIVVSSYGSCTGSNRPIWTKSGNGFAIILKSSDWIDISNLDFRGYQIGHELRGAQNITYTDVVTRNPANHCYAVQINEADNNRPSSNVVFTRTEADTCGSTGNGEGFYLGDNGSGGSADITITNSYIHDTFFECLEVKEGTDPSITIRHNTFDGCHRTDHDPTTDPGGDSGEGLVAADGDGGDSSVTIEFNWIKNVIGSRSNTGDGIRFTQQGVLARHNVIMDNERNGVVTTAGSGTQGDKEFYNNTIYNNGLACLSLAGSTNSTQSDNTCWANGSGNDASNPNFVNAAADNFNFLSSSPLYQAGAGGISKGALQPFEWTSASLLSDGITVRVTGAVYSLFQPISIGTANNFTLDCSTAGSQSGSMTIPDGNTSILVTFPTSIGSEETCTLDATYQAAEDSANIGGSLAPGGPLNSHSLAVTGLSVTNGSTSGGGTPSTAPNLLMVSGLLTNCSNCDVTFGCEKMLDTSIADTGSDFLSASGESAICEFDLGSAKTLDNFRMYCDAGGTRKTTDYQVRGKVNLGDGYTTIVDEVTCNSRAWFQSDMGDSTYRYIEIQIECDSCAGIQAFEMELTETPQTEPFPGSRTVSQRGLVWR